MAHGRLSRGITQAPGRLDANHGGHRDDRSFARDPGGDQAGTITSVSDGSYVMRLLQPPRGPPRPRR
jgi:hypothetical protein